MIVDRLQSANSVILDSVNAANNKHAVESFKNQLAVLSVLTAQLEQLINLTEAMQDKGITSTIMTMEIKNPGIFRSFWLLGFNLSGREADPAPIPVA